MLSTKEIADFIDRERRLQFDQQSAYMKVLGLPRQNYSRFIEYLKKERSRASFTQINKYLKPLGYELVIQEIPVHQE